MAARLSALGAGHTLPSGFFIFKDSWYSFLLEAESTPGPVRPERLGQFKKSTSSELVTPGKMNIKRENGREDEHNEEEEGRIEEEEQIK
jgi:hypothetical protein